MLQHGLRRLSRTTRTLSTAGGAPIHDPTAERVAASRLAAFADAFGSEGAYDLAHYDRLHAASVAEPRKFWRGGGAAASVWGSRARSSFFRSARSSFFWSDVGRARKRAAEPRVSRAPPRPRRGHSAETSRGAAATRTFRGDDESPRRRDANVPPRRVAAPPRPPRGVAAEATSALGRRGPDDRRGIRERSDASARTQGRARRRALFDFLELPGSLGDAAKDAPGPVAWNAPGSPPGAVPWFADAKAYRPRGIFGCPRLHEDDTRTATLFTKTTPARQRCKNYPKRSSSLRAVAATPRGSAPMFRGGRGDAAAGDVDSPW